MIASAKRGPRTAPGAGVRSFTTVAAFALVSCSGGVTDSARVATIELEPEAVVVAVGAVAPLTATVEDAGGNPVSSQVSWSSSDTSVARVSSAGVVTARKVGDATIAATSQGVSATAVVTVSPQSVSSVRITPTAAAVRVGATTQLEATALDADGNALPGRSMIWSSNSRSVATVDAAGRVTGVAPGAATITATSEGRAASAAVTVTLLPVASVSIDPVRDTLRQGDVRQLAATARDEGGAALPGRMVSWSSSHAHIASVTSSGLVTAVLPGKAVISASSEGISAKAEIVVLARPVHTVSISPLSSTVQVGANVPLSATLRDSEGNLLSDRGVAWTPGNASVATVSSSGVVTGVAPGATFITATSEGRTGTATVDVIAIPVASVTVTPATTTILTGRTATYTATAQSASGAVLTGRAVNWTSGAPGIATINGSGVVTGVSPGTALIIAEVEGVTGSASITIEQPAVASVVITPQNPSIGVGGMRQLVAKAFDSDGNEISNRPVSWSSSDDATVFVTSIGVAIGLRKGTATITATIDGISGTTVVTVN